MSTLIFRPVTKGTFQRVLSAPQKATRIFIKRAPARIFWTYKEYLQLVFASEGIPKWAELAEFTIEERRSLGFPPEHPILERTGAFRRALTDPASPDFVQEQTSLGSNSFTLRFGTTDPRFIEFQHGTAIMPARPIMPHTDVGKREWVIKIEDMLEDTLSNLVREVSRG